ncbi:hypothetical protein DXG03_004694 [Asterophora parasitica]|uniref:Tf2-1-like SH3-like domain-containing protein n=1 Tax=Asterophora parasitica TaxID=117018 RepID=A0A9P7KB87_9AGAR|nr:hypothetical protein DXG03_004694 [Asterophora parasitica]
MPNIAFPKGFARKLVPKYIGLYKILKDYGNQSFRVDLPAHLKQRGVHDTFHASLLRVHIPNDDRLFPGRLDTQLGNQDDSENEWAVDAITGHTGARQDAVFQVRWRSGDLTWMPYYQITHLDALANYFDLLGITRIEDLAAGTTKPPTEDPQIFISAIGPNLDCVGDKRLSVPSQPPSSFFPSSHPTNISATLPRNPYHTIMTNNLPTSIPPLKTQQHSGLHRTGREDFVLINPVNQHSAYYHAITIYSYIIYDVKLRKAVLPLTVPGGYAEFAAAFNHGDHGCNIRFAVNSDSLRDLTTSLAPTIAEFQVHPSHIFQLTVEKGGRVLDRRRAMITDDLLWESAASQSRQRAFRSRKKAERLEKKASARAPTGTQPGNKTASIFDLMTALPTPTHTAPGTPATNLNQLPFGLMSDATDFFSAGDVDADGEIDAEASMIA